MTKFYLPLAVLFILNVAHANSVNTCERFFGDQGSATNKLKIATNKDAKEYKNAASIGPNRALLHREGNQATLNWQQLLKEVKTNLAANIGYKGPLTVTVRVDGEAKYTDIPESRTHLTMTEKEGLQTDYFLEFKGKDGKVLHRSDLELKETKDAQNIRAVSFSGITKTSLFSIKLNEFLKKAGLGERLTSVATDLGYQKIVWVIKPDADPQIKKMIEDAPAGVEVEIVLSESRQPLTAKIYDKKTGSIIAEAVSVAKNFFVKVDAAFNGNSFLWDDALVALATVQYHPELAKSTLDFWLTVQDHHNGMIPREVRKSNLKSLWFQDVISNGKNLGQNLQYTNPYLLNWVAEAIYDNNPSVSNLKLLARVAKSMEAYTRQLETLRTVKDKHGMFIGFNANSLGSGADNSRGERGNNHSKESYQSAWVDMLAQHISMYKSMSKIYDLLSKATKNNQTQATLINASKQKQARALAYEKILNDLYWNEQSGFYYDLVPDGKGGFKQDSNYESIAGFWPLYSGSASPQQVQKIAQKQLTPDAFGGSWPLRVNSLRALKLDPKSKDPNTRSYMENKEEDGYWDKWAHWPSMAAITIEGFRRSGRPDIAFDLATKFIAGMTKVSPDTVYELYGESRTVLPDGRVEIKARVGQHGHHQTRDDFAGWGKVPPIYNMMSHVLGLEPKSGTMKWNLMVPMKAGETLAANNLSFNGANIKSLAITKIDETHYEITTESTQPFNIELSSYLDNQTIKAKPTAKAKRIRIGGNNQKQTYQVELK